MPPVEPHTPEAPERPPLSPAARWAAACVLGALGVAGVWRGLVASPPVMLGAGSVAAREPGRTPAGPVESSSVQDSRSGIDSAAPNASTPIAPGVVRKVNLNTAGAAELDLLPGIGPALAARIIADRQAHGPFASLDDLDRVPGIGPKTVAKLVPYASAD